MLVLTLLFLNAVGLHRTWDLRSYTGDALGLLSGRKRAYGYFHTERLLSEVARALGGEVFTDALARWTAQLWQMPGQEAFNQLTSVYVDGHRKPVYTDTLIPRGLVGRLSTILGSRALVLLHDASGHPLLVTTHRGDQHLTTGLPAIVKHYEQEAGADTVQQIIVDREGMAAEFLAALKEAGRTVISLLRTDQYTDLDSFTDIGDFLPLCTSREGKVLREVAPASIALPLPEQKGQSLQLRVALIRDLHRQVPLPPSEEERDYPRRWDADLPWEERRWWEPGWQATPSPALPTVAKLIPIVSTAEIIDAVELAETYTRRWPLQENIIRDFLLPLGLDTNHGYAKERVVNSETVKRRTVLEKRVAHLHRLAAESRKRLRQMHQSDQVREQQVVIWEQRQQDLLAQVLAMETSGQSSEPGLLAIKAQQLEAEWEVHHRRVLLKATNVAGKRELNHCERSCRALRHVLRQQEELRACEREMQELDNTKDQIMTLLKVGLANLGLWVRDHYFGESYQTCGWERLMPFFQLSGWITATETEVRLDFSPFNHRGMERDLQVLCRKVNTDGAQLPDGRRLVLTVGQQRSRRLDGPLANSG